MTVIAWDGKTLAADKRCGTQYPRKVTKIRRTRDGGLIGIAGWMDHGMALFEWFEAGADTAKLPECQKSESKSCELIVIKPNGTVWIIGDSGIPWQVENRCHAIGSGRDFAAAAMHLGYPASEAVEIACALTATCGDGIDTLTLEA